MKERKRALRKTQVRIVSRVEMTADQQVSFTKATDSLLAELVKSLDRQKGEPYGHVEEQMAGVKSNHCRQTERRQEGHSLHRGAARSRREKAGRCRHHRGGQPDAGRCVSGLSRSDNRSP